MSPRKWLGAGGYGPHVCDCDEPEAHAVAPLDEIAVGNALDEAWLESHDARDIPRTKYWRLAAEEGK